MRVHSYIMTSSWTFCAESLC